MNPINDGGPAFPIENGNWNMSGGMSLRDYFAAAAMQATIARLGAIARVDKTGSQEVLELLIDTPAVDEAKGQEIRNAVVELSYQYADAMLKARALQGER